MYRVSRTPNTLTITELRWPWALLCAVFMVTTAVGGIQGYRDESLNGFQLAAMAVAFIATCIGVVVFSAYTNITIDRSAKRITWRRNRLGKRSHGDLAFRDIESVGVAARQRSTLTVTCVVVYSKHGDLPLSTLYSARYDDNKRLATEVRALVFGDSPISTDDLIARSVRAMVERGQTQQATALLVREGNCSLAEARAHVRGIVDTLEVETD